MASLGSRATVVFTDLQGSTAAFESLGNALATETVTHTTAWIAQQCERANGRVVKTLGDGVLALFAHSQGAIEAVVELQRAHAQRLLHSPPDSVLPLRIGLATGEVELVDNDCYGDAVNVASRLCGLCGPHQIWADAATLDTVPQGPGITLRMLGPIPIRGRAEPCKVFQVEWRAEEFSEFLTMQGDASLLQALGATDVLGREVELRWQDQVQRFKAFELPVHLGRVRGAEFLVSDPRVSRTHARLDWRNGSIVLVDMSSYGSWIRFGTGASEVLLRREECVLHGEGVLALGTSFADPLAPLVHFRVL